MELQIARQIIDTLAQGIHPVTGEAMPDDSPYNAAPVIRALHAVSRAEGMVAFGPEHRAGLDQGEVRIAGDFVRRLHVLDVG